VTTLTQAARSAVDAARAEDARLAMLRQDARQLQEQLDQAEDTREKAEQRLGELREQAISKKNEITAQEVVCQQARGLAEAVDTLGITVPAQQPVPAGSLPVEAEAHRHYQDDPTITQAYPAVQTGDGGQIAVTDPGGSPNEPQLLDRRPPRRGRA
jgi:hypothetical protein